MLRILYKRRKVVKMSKFRFVQEPGVGRGVRGSVWGMDVNRYCVYVCVDGWVGVGAGVWEGAG